jgi:hypothetical protein
MKREPLPRHHEFVSFRKKGRASGSTLCAAYRSWSRKFSLPFAAPSSKRSSTLCLPQEAPDEERVWLYGDESHQAIILSQHENGDLNLRYQPVRGLRQDSDGSVRFDPAQLDIGFPLRLWEDSDSTPFTKPDTRMASWRSTNNFCEIRNRKTCRETLD